MSNNFKDLSIEGEPCTELGRKAVGPRQGQDPFERAMVTPGAAAPGTKAKQLLGLPHTIREKILGLVLAGNGFVHISYSRLKQTDTRYARGYGHLHKCSLGLKEGGTSIFLACRQLRNEAARVLYGSTSFSSFNATGLREQFVPHQMGRDNASYIRKLTLGVPESLKLEPDTALPKFLDLFCDVMPNLQTLDFTTRFTLFSILHNDIDKGEPCSWIKEQRAMLNTAAWITLRHPKLKKAIWLAKSGEDDEEGEQEVRFYVKLLALDMKYALRTHTPMFAFMDSDEERRDMILDSYAIRREGWDGLFSGRANLYGLSEDAESSEVKAIANNPEDQLKYMSSKKKQQGSKSRAKAIKGLTSWR